MRPEVRMQPGVDERNAQREQRRARVRAEVRCNQLDLLETVVFVLVTVLVFGTWYYAKPTVGGPDLESEGWAKWFGLVAVLNFLCLLYAFWQYMSNGISNDPLLRYDTVWNAKRSIRKAWGCLFRLVPTVGVFVLANQIENGSVLLTLAFILSLPLMTCVPAGMVLLEPYRNAKAALKEYEDTVR